MVRKADECDLEEILLIYDKARAYMRQMGNPCQWQGSYPGRAVLEYDIDQEQLYVLYDDFGIYGVFMMRIGDDPTYASIRTGSWLDDSPYAVIHRIASSGRRKGVLHEALLYTSRFTHHIRIDTHELNRPMQSALAREGFVRTGIIICSDGTYRFSFELVGD